MAFGTIDIFLDRILRFYILRPLSFMFVLENQHKTINFLVCL